MKRISKFINKYLHIFIVIFVALVCTVFIVVGKPSENGFITLDGKDAEISDSTKQFIEDSKDALNRIMNEDKPTDDEAIKINNIDEVGKGFYTTIDQVLGRRLNDGNNDGGDGWQCSRYTAWLGTGKWSYSATHPDYGPVNGKAIAEWLVNNYGFKYISEPVKGAIGSGGFNTLYGHTAMFLYYTGENTAMVNDANYVPLTVSTHNMNIDGWVWVVPGNYEPEPTPAPTPAPESDEVFYTYKQGDYFSKVLKNLNLDENNLWGDNGTVNYYTKQLIDQNMLDLNGNVKVGIPFKLVKR